MAKYGFLDGVDQATFVESFMKKGVQNVFASYWQLDDDAAKTIMSNFWKILKEQKDKPDLIAAYAKAQREYLDTYKKQMIKNNIFVDDLQPYYWAAGAMFGK